MVRRLPIVALLLALAAPGGRAQTPPTHPKASARYALILDLPAQEVQAKRRFHRLSDSGVSADMRNAETAYQKELVGMVVRVAGRYYPPRHFGPQGIRPRLEALLAAQGKLGYDVLDVTGKGDMGQDSLLGLDGEASSRVADVLKDMVEAISDQDPDGLNDDRWLAAWTRAEATGD